MLHLYRLIISAAVTALLSSPLRAQEPLVPPPLSMECGTCATLIHDIQGSGKHSPLIPEGQKKSTEVVVEAVVTANTPERLSGFFIQEEITDEDNDPETSEGLFVYGKQPQLRPGDRVRVKGVISEFYGNTQIELSEIRVCGENALQEVRPVIPPSRELVLQDIERYEGMLLSFSEAHNLSVTRNYSFNFDSRRNNMDLSMGGPLFKPTQLYPPLSEQAVALQKKNDSNRITLITDEKKQTRGRINYYPAFGPFIHYIRVGDTISELNAVVTYRYGNYELVPTEPLDTYSFLHDFNPRKAFPDPHNHGTLRVASFNVLNYFNTLVTGHKENPAGQNRGAKSLEEFELQRDKIVEAVTRIDADIIGVMEIENNGFGEGSAIHDLLKTINGRLPPSEHYAAVNTYEGGPIGSDAITVGLIYKPARIDLEGGMITIPPPVQKFTLTNTENEKVSFTKSMRPTLLQTFRDKASGQTVTVAVNHFKSKGSMCFEDYMNYATPDGKVPLSGTRIKRGSKPTLPGYQDDLQGNCNELRVAASKNLADHLKTLKGLLSENLLIIGDLNAYGEEDPVRVLTGSTRALKTTARTSVHTTVNCQDFPPETIEKGYGFANLMKKHHGAKYFTYCYDGELGSLDYALASKSLLGKIESVQDWHINSVENSLFEYPDKYSGDLPKTRGPFSASDHDPLLIDLNLWE